MRFYYYQHYAAGVATYPDVAIPDPEPLPTERLGATEATRFLAGNRPVGVGALGQQSLAS